MEPLILKKLVKIDKAVNKANYDLALKMSDELAKAYPKNMAVLERYATMLADYAQYRNPKNKVALKKKAVRILKKLTHCTRGLSLKDRGDIRNEYYHHSDQFLKQYKLGVELVNLGETSFYFSQGAGASWHAYHLYKKGHVLQAQKWAQKSVMAWKKYLNYSADYYYPYVNLAFALGILDKKLEMETMLDKAQKLSGKPKNYSEFKNIRTWINDL